MKKVAIIIPCYNVKSTILSVLEQIKIDVHKIYVVDDFCPQQSGQFVKERYSSDDRVSVLFNKKNMGVGGAVLIGYQKALEEGADILVKIDGDGQMDPELIPLFINPIIEETADYTKGNRFFYLSSLKAMPWGRVIGNSLLSFITKVSSGYWDIFDPTNGYTAISANALKMLSLDKINKRYFFESDMLFHLNISRAVVIDIPMNSVYPEENISHLHAFSNMPLFIWGNIKNTYKRITYNYYIRDFTLASIQLVLSILLLTFGVTIGISEWMNSLITNHPSTSGTVMLSALPIILGAQLLLSFINYDIASVPKISLARRMKWKIY